jgi:hypothetical protein
LNKLNIENITYPIVLPATTQNTPISSPRNKVVPLMPLHKYKVHKKKKDSSKDKDKE